MIYIALRKVECHKNCSVLTSKDPFHIVLATFAKTPTYVNYKFVFSIPDTVEFNFFFNIYAFTRQLSLFT